MFVRPVHLIVEREVIEPRLLGTMLNQRRTGRGRVGRRTSRLTMNVEKRE